MNIQEKIEKYKGKPKYVTIHQVQNRIFIGDYLGFKNCDDIHGCRVFYSKKVNKIKPWQYVNCCRVDACRVLPMIFIEKIKYWLGIGY